MSPLSLFSAIPLHQNDTSATIVHLVLIENAMSFVLCHLIEFSFPYVYRKIIGYLVDDITDALLVPLKILAEWWRIIDRQPIAGIWVHYQPARDRPAVVP